MDHPRDHTGTDDGPPADDGRWLSYAELAEVRGITRKAAARLALRHRWRRQPGNDGATRVLVPGTVQRKLTPPPTSLTPPSDSAVTPPPDGPSDAATFAAALAAITEAHASEVAALRALLERADAARQDALERLQALEATIEAGKARGRWQRLRAAWRRE
jgi:hypothetical protein